MLFVMEAGRNEPEFVGLLEAPDEETLKNAFAEYARYLAGPGPHEWFSNFAQKYGVRKVEHVRFDWTDKEETMYCYRRLR